MDKSLLDEFIAYAKEEFGYDIQVKESSTPDTFERIFGTSFLKQELETETIPVTYKNTEQSITFKSNSVMLGVTATEVAFAA